ncbi:putative WRKY transcription factor 2 [Sesamum alatum]|uniref:WRKY transcription factor 2 n=1 Tax=Sesamum alatum TaxID=300844 RepID=A0AAE1YN51_9LAMI|nr:putative WRKY transcription factor 2 [Sesamum alatum]
MGANGGAGPPFVKREDEFHDSNCDGDDDNPISMLENHNLDNGKGISIAERRAAKCGFNASNINAARFRTTGLATPPLRSPYFTVPPGLSPSALLDSPIMLPNAQAQLSPTTGTFHQFPSPNHESLKLKLKLASSCSATGDHNSTFAAESSSSKQPLSHSLPPNTASLLQNKAAFEELEYQRDLQETASKNVDCFEDTLTETDQVMLGGNSNNNQYFSSLQPRNNHQMFMSSQNDHQQNIKDMRSSSTHPNQEKLHHQKGPYFPKDQVAKYSEDGFYWRKYGQKHVKGSEYPRSYYKCTNTNCQVKKKVERSHDGQITEIVYKGSHNHPKPQPFKRLVSEMSSSDMSPEGSSSATSCFKTEGKDVAFASDCWRPDHSLDGTSSTSFLSDFSDPLSRMNTIFESVETQEFSSAFASQDADHDQNGASPESISFNDEDDDQNGECEPKKRKRDSFPSETTTARSTREPRVIVQIESDIDILDDGYRWRKYGQKVVKGNPNPRSYYKCTTPGCPVRKHVERAANDIKSVVTTYEGKHNHEVPCSKNGSLVISDVANLPPSVTNSTVPTPSPIPQKPDHHPPKSGKQVQDHLPSLYLERKPILNYNELMRSNLPGSFTSDLSFGASSVYPLSFPPFHSLPNYSSLLMNGNQMKTSYASSNLYPMLPDYMPLPAQVNHVVAAGSTNVPLAGNFHYNNYATTVNQSSNRGNEMRDCQPKVVKPKEEQRDDGELYDTCLSIPNPGNGTI